MGLAAPGWAGSRLRAWGSGASAGSGPRGGADPGQGEPWRSLGLLPGVSNGCWSSSGPEAGSRPRHRPQTPGTLEIFLCSLRPSISLLFPELRHKVAMERTQTLPPAPTPLPRLHGPSDCPPAPPLEPWTSQPHSAPAPVLPWPWPVWWAVLPEAGSKQVKHPPPSHGGQPGGSCPGRAGGAAGDQAVAEGWLQALKRGGGRGSSRDLPQPGHGRQQ